MKLFGYSISLNVLILIGILYLIMVVNALSGSCNREGLTGVERALKPSLDVILMQANKPGATKSQVQPVLNQTMNDLLTKDSAMLNLLTSVQTKVNNLPP
jgi:hypothetical protein